MTLREAFSQKILLLDGAMGSLIQTYGYQGNYDELALTHPDVLHDVARRYLEAGADVITTCTFSSQRIGQAEYHLEDKVAELNHAAARIAIEEARRFTAANPSQPRFVLGDVGPTSKMLSMSDDVNDPAARAITFDELEDIYREQMTALMAEGVDGILIETIFDTLNAKAALSAFAKAKAETGKDCEVLLSMTVSDASGRTLSGQTVEAFVTSVLHAQPLCIGLNCGLGADGMLPYLRQMSACCPTYVSCHPNAGLPNQFGGYDDTPAQMVGMMQAYLDEGLVNMLGGCCGTTPEYIAAFRQMIDRYEGARRKLAATPDSLMLAGLEPFRPGQEFAMVGERCNVAGSRKFLRLISEKNYDEALDIARKQVEDGAQVIDINMDDGLLDAEQEMRTFLNLIASDPAISRVPIMVDSSRFEVIEAGLKCVQGKGIVNSISLKQGEETFLRYARTVHRLGAAVIFMLFDEEGQATDYERRIRIAERGYRLLVDEVGFRPSDIIIDPNVLTVATGMAEHNAYAADFVRATRWITEHLPGVRISGGLSNLSFAFRGNNYLREAMHSVFLHHAIPNGMGMAILNPASAVNYRTIPLELRMAITEVLLNTYPEAPEELMEIAARMNAAQQAAKEAGTKYDPKAIFSTPTTQSSPTEKAPVVTKAETTKLCVEERLKEALIKGTTTTIEADVLEMIHRGDSPLDIISGPLMEGMNTVGKLFGEGKMFLPQVVKTARTMKKAVEVLQPYMGKDANEGSSSSSVGTVLLATVKGDVHDIGKNIVGVVLACNNFRVIDLGVMVPTEQIIETAIEQKVDFVCLSGLITPSLEEMCHVAQAMQQAGLTIPLFVGGATTSAIHTAVKIAPLYDGGVFHLTDAAKNPVLAMQLMDPTHREEILQQNLEQQQAIRNQQAYKQSNGNPPTADAAVSQTDTYLTPSTDWPGWKPVFLGQQVHAPIPLSELIPLIDWTYFYWPWRVKADSDEGRSLKADADTLLAELTADSRYDMRALTAFYPAAGSKDGIVLEGGIAIDTPATKKGNALNRYVAPQDDHVGLFAATVSDTFIKRLESLKQEAKDDYASLLLQTLGDVLVEATSEYLQRELEATGWRGIRPAVGYPLLPDQKQIFQLAKLIDYASIGISLTENGAMYPQSSVSGLYIGHPEARYS